MLNNNTKRTLFLEKAESLSPVKLSNLSDTGRDLIFYNSNSGSRLTECEDIAFRFKKKESIKIIDVKKMGQKTSVNITGKIKWLEDARQVMCGKDKSIPKMVRAALLVDETASITLSVWGTFIQDITEDTTLNCVNLITEFYNNLRVATTSSTVFSIANDETNVDWNKHKIVPQSIKLCCPLIDTVKVDKIHQCINIDCKKKVVFFPGENTVSCNACKLKMRVSRCPTNLVAELTLTENEDDTKQHQVTIFGPVLMNMVNIKGETADALADILLMEENWDFVVNKKKVVTCVSKHTITFVPPTTINE